MTNLVRQINTAFVIAGQPFPVYQWKARLANQGNMATAEAEGAYSDLVDSGLDILAASAAADGAELDIYAGYDGDSRLIFSGVVDDIEIDADQNLFEVKGRDWASKLADGRQTMAGMNYRNQTIGMIVHQIADKLGFNSDITDPGTNAGPTMNGENFFNPRSTDFWNLLQTLAADVGYECWVTPDQTLHFGPEQDQGTINCTYGGEPNSGVENPAWGLKVKFNPRNNSNITVKAISYDPQTTQKVIASATAAPLNVKAGKKTATSITSTSKVKYPSPGKSGSSGTPKTVHYIRCAGLTPEQAQAKCKAQADELAKHQLIISICIEGNPDIRIHSNLVINQVQIDAISEVPLNVAEVEHSFSMDQGYVTACRALGQIA